RLHYAHFVEPDSEQRLGGLVVVHETALGIDDEDRHVQVARQLTQKDQLDGTLYRLSVRHVGSSRSSSDAALWNRVPVRLIEHDLAEVPQLVRLRRPRRVFV